MHGTYRTLLGLYPADYAALFGAGMLVAFEKAAGERRAGGTWVFLRFAFAEMAGLVVGVAREWIAKLTTDRSVRARCLPDLRMMRPVGVPKELWFREAGRA